MKIVHVWWQLGYGGIETMLVNIANEQLKLGADVYIVVINDNNEEKLVASLDKRVHFICLGRRLKSHNPIFIYNYNKVLREIRPDVIHLHDSRFYTLILNRELSRIAVSTLHDLPKGSIRRTDWGHTLPAFLHFREPGNVLYINKIHYSFLPCPNSELELLQSRHSEPPYNTSIPCCKRNLEIILLDLVNNKPINIIHLILFTFLSN